MSGIYNTEALISWDQNPESDIGGYQVYMGIFPGVYDRILTTTGLSQVIPCQDGVRTYATVVAFDTSGNYSSFSAEVSIIKTVPVTTVMKITK